MAPLHIVPDKKLIAEVDEFEKRTRLVNESTNEAPIPPLQIEVIALPNNIAGLG
jgi:hypothetical protein